MKSTDTLWNQRVKEYWNMAIRYLRLIGNSGFLFTIYLLIIIGAYYYSILLNWLPKEFPASYVFIAVMSYLLTRSPIRTFLTQGDVVFLTPLEDKLTRYFRSSIIYTAILQCCSLLVVMILLSPLFTQRVNEMPGAIYGVIGLLFVAKVWNVVCSWEEYRLQETDQRVKHTMLRLIVNLVFTFIIFAFAHVAYIIGLLAIMAILYLFYYRHFGRQHSIKWEQLIEMEERLLTMFYRIANQFTDVPKLKNKVSSRRWLQFILTGISFTRKNTFNYLFLRSFLRANDYFGMFVRILIVGAILLIVIPPGPIRILLFLLFIYMSGLQLSTLWNHYHTKLWVDLYPIAEEEKKNSFSSILFRLLLGKTIIFTLILFAYQESFVNVLILFSVGTIFSYFYSFKLVYRKLRTVEG
ncbi:ABC transporter permease [Bacillus alkalicellulosilyticus]|uniref:ABC transporter permease n=1 Tax=Alkalihalobacterium alkalicellulosilyticum TaxID=1912214 RepID=UPI000998031D|nr:ABC transporter permease [Bacillus alkalicellulosilyticus]